MVVLGAAALGVGGRQRFGFARHLFVNLRPFLQGRFRRLGRFRALTLLCSSVRVGLFLFA